MQIPEQTLLTSIENSILQKTYRNEASTSTKNFEHNSFQSVNNEESNNYLEYNSFQSVNNEESIKSVDIQVDMVKESEEKELTYSSATKPSVELSISKWRQIRYQRSERAKRARIVITDSKQTLITNFFKLADQVSNIINNFNLGSSLISNLLKPKIVEKTAELVTETTENIANNFLKKLLEISQKNIQGPKNKNFYDVATKKFAIYIFYVGGRLLYETLYANLPKSLPSITTLNRYLTNNREPIEEGEFDFEGLAQFLDSRNLPKIIWVAEDGTRVNSKIEYNERANKVVGFVLPLKNGVPSCDKYIASSAKKIQNFFETSARSNYAYVITAQPLSYDAPAYCVSVFGTDNKFTAQEVLQRWEYMKRTAKNYGITIIGLSSDGDYRLLKAMRINSVLPKADAFAKAHNSVSDTEPDNHFSDIMKCNWFHTDITKVDECYIQDSVHIITKLRTRFLKPGIILPLGHYSATVEHLYKL